VAPVLRLVEAEPSPEPEEPPPSRLTAVCDGFDLHAETCFGAEERGAIERFIRYAARRRFPGTFLPSPGRFHQYRSTPGVDCEIEVTGTGQRDVAAGGLAVTAGGRYDAPHVTRRPEGISHDRSEW
jgi:hypothetical protein